MHIPDFQCNGFHMTPAEQAKCPVCARKTTLFKIKTLVDKESFLSDSLTPFVGRFGYPNINVGLLGLPEQNEESWLHDAPRVWAQNEYQIPQIVDLRSALVNSRFTLNVRNQSRFLEVSQEVGMAKRPVDVEITLEKKPTFQMSFSNYNAPMGPVARLKKADITENPKIERSVDKVYSDTDLKARDALIYLYKKEFDEHFLTKLLSIGIVGVKMQRKLVPTRWSLTATDSIIGNHLVSEIKSFKEVDTHTTFFGSYLGNYYLVMLFPEIYSYELFESYVPRTPYEKLRFGTDYEPYSGRKEYAANTVGGFYACRLGLLEKLKLIRRQASALVLRFISSEYTVPMGVFVCREATRKAMANKPLEFSSKELMLKYAESLVKKKFNVDVNQILQQSIQLKSLKSQQKLSRFL